MKNTGRWVPAPSSFSPVFGVVDIFRLDLTLDQARVAVLRGYLSDEERTRSDRYRREQDGQRFTAAHGQVREVLACYTGLPPGAIQFEKNNYGKPQLGTPKNLQFNLSHSHDLALLAVSWQKEVGIDVERIRDDVDSLALPRRFFTAEEEQALSSLPEDQRRQVFFSSWTRKEAYIKARGMGLAIPLDQFIVTVGPQHPLQIYSIEQEEKVLVPWSLHDVNLGEHHAASLVVEGEINDIRCWTWPGHPTSHS